MRAGNFVKLTKYYHNAEEGWGGQTKRGIYLTSGEVMESYERSIICLMIKGYFPPSTYVLQNLFLNKCSSDGKGSICNAGDPGLIPGLGRSPGERNSYLLQNSGLENSMDCTVHRVTKSQT